MADEAEEGSERKHDPWEPIREWTALLVAFAALLLRIDNQTQNSEFAKRQLHVELDAPAGS